MPVDLTPKNAAIKLLERADKNVSYEEIMYELHVLQKIERGLKDVEEGRTTSHEKVKQEFKKWLT
jgi:predicted transcriptional regulator